MEPLASLVEEFLQDKEKNLSPNTYRVYAFALDKMLEFFKSIGVTTADGLTERNLMRLAAWTAKQPKANVPNAMKSERTGEEPDRLTPGGVHVRLRPVRTFYEWCYRYRIIDSNPFHHRSFCQDFFPRLKEVTLPVVREADFLKLMRVAAKTRNPLRDQAILSLLMATGMRASDLCNLTLEDVTSTPGYIHVRGSKGGKNRDIPVSREVKGKVMAYVRSERPDVETDRIFIAGMGADLQPMNRNSLNQLITRLCKAAGLKHLTPHAFRRGFVTLLDREGVPRKVTQAVLGHTSPLMTDVYSRLNKEDVRQVLHEVNPVKRALSRVKQRGLRQE